ncbi:MAG: universal stress protein [Nitrososphaerales archaeon]|jgi:nucleotide-binding universal stress UspA family protein
MDQLVVAVDGSQHSAKVVDYAAQLARSIPARILLVNVIPDPRVPSGYVEYTKMDGLDPNAYFERVAQHISETLGSRLKLAGLEYEVATRIGNPANLVLGLAKRRKASMIIIGVFGLHHLGRTRSLGSVSRRIVENSSIPVVLVP